jgi:hypothetical protein
MINKDYRKKTVRQEGFAIIFAVLMLFTLTTMGLVASDIAMMETNIASSDYCIERARSRAWSCTQYFMQAVAGQTLPSFKINNLDPPGELDTNTVECLVPGLLGSGGSDAGDAEVEGEGGVNIGKLTADLYSTDYVFQMFVSTSIGFAGKGCGHQIYDSENDAFGVLSDGEIAVGITYEQEVGMAFGPCKGDGGC